MHGDQLVHAYLDALNRGDADGLGTFVTEDAVIDWSRSRGPERGVYEGPAGMANLAANLFGAWEELHFGLEETVALGPDALVVVGLLKARGRSSGAEVSARGVQLWRLRGGLICGLELHQAPAEALGSWRLERLRHARLYFVCDPIAGVEEVLDAALRGGADIVQLREKSPRCAEELVALAEPFRRAARRHGALFILNDRPDLVAEAGADGVHVGQDDSSVADARAQAGADALVGLSTHEQAQLDTAEAASGHARPDYVSIGPVWETPTKAGRPAAGLDYVRYAAANATLPWFAIGGIDPQNVGDVAAAGAERVVVVRAIRDAPDAEAAARELRAALPAAPSYEKVTAWVPNS